MQEKEKKAEPALIGKLEGVIGEQALHGEQSESITEEAEPTLNDIVLLLDEGFQALEDVLKDIHNSLTIIERKLPDSP